MNHVQVALPYNWAIGGGMENDGVASMLNTGALQSSDQRTTSPGYFRLRLWWVCKALPVD